MRHAVRTGTRAGAPALAVGRVAHDVLGVGARNVRPERCQRAYDARLVEEDVAVCFVKRI